MVEVVNDVEQPVSASYGDCWDALYEGLSDFCSGGMCRIQGVYITNRFAELDGRDSRHKCRWRPDP